MLITLSGLDGAGKSTLAEALQASLDRDGIPAVVLHMNKDVGLYACVRNLRDALIGRVASLGRTLPVDRAVDTQPRELSRSKMAILDLRRRIIWNKPLRRWVDLGDLLLFYGYRLYLERVRGLVVIMDRYFYDRLADQADSRRWKYLRWFARLVPLPDLPVLVEVSAEEAFARKGEYSIESMTLRRSNYREIFSWVPGSVILPNDDLGSAIEGLAQLARRRMAVPGARTMRVRG